MKRKEYSTLDCLEGDADLPFNMRDIIDNTVSACESLSLDDEGDRDTLVRRLRSSISECMRPFHNDVYFDLRRDQREGDLNDVQAGILCGTVNLLDHIRDDLRGE